MTYDREDYKGRNTIERAFNQLKTWRGLATRYDKHALPTAGASSSAPSSSGCGRFERHALDPSACVADQVAN